MIYFCAQQKRRELVLGVSGLNGIDYLEVLGPAGRGTQLAVTFLKPATSLMLTTPNIGVTGGGAGNVAYISISGGAAVQVASVTQPTAGDPTITITLDQTGDFSTYTLALIAGPGTTDPPDGIDPQLAAVDFSFKAGCPTPADCRPVNCCPPAPTNPPDINYLAKDYNGFLQVMLDRLAVLTPGWAETHAADLGVALTEVLAYTADHLSYQQDAISTEAHLGTARSRISLRRHARLVDYPIGEGCNARTLVCITTSGATGLTMPTGTQFYVRIPGLPPAAAAGDATDQQLQASTQPVFTSMQDALLYDALNTINFYTWGDEDCCLPAGATQATLAGSLGMLQPGSFLIFEEVVGPLTGAPGDADPSHRCAVQLTEVSTTDHQQRPRTDPLNGTPITLITWADADALPFPLCISSTAQAPGSPELPAVSVARGNIVPAEHRTPVVGESLGAVPSPPPEPDPSITCTCAPSTQAAPSTPLPRYYPQLAQSPLTFHVRWAGGVDSAAAFLAPGATAAVPCITLTGSDGSTWTPVPDLLSSLGTGPFGQVFVPEIEFNGSAFVRFGDNQHGVAPEEALSFTADYSVGNGTTGNIGRDALAHAVVAPNEIGKITAVRNPLPGIGGTDPEDMEHIRQFAPFAYEQQQRCVTEADYGAMAAQTGGVIAARGTLRWTGSWYTACASIEPAAALPTQQLPAPSGLRVVGSKSGGTFAAGSYFWKVTATNANGETVGSTEAATALTSASSAALSWTPVAGATGYKVYRGTTAGHENARVATMATSWTVTYTDTGLVGTPASPPDVNTAAVPPLDNLIADTTTQLDMLRMMGTDVEVEPAVIVGLQIEMAVCVDPQHFQGDVFQALMMVFITGDQCNGTTGLLNPASFTFGETIYASPLIAAAQAVEGVVSATMTTFTRMDAPWVDGVALGCLTMGRLDIARCDNDPDHLDHGTFTLHLDGGK